MRAGLNVCQAMAPTSVLCQPRRCILWVARSLVSHLQSHVPSQTSAKIEFRYNADEPYWHTFGYAEGYAPLEGGKRLHLSYWYGTKFEGWPREEQDFHEIWDRVKKIEMAWQRSRIAQKVEKSIPTKLFVIINLRSLCCTSLSWKILKL